MKRLFATFLLVFLFSCSGPQQWQHSGKSRHDFAIDDRECQYLAEAKAREESLVPQPIPSTYYNTHSNCLQAKGWQPLDTVNYIPESVEVKISDTETEFVTSDFSLTLDGRYNLLQQQESGFLIEKEGAYIYLMFQLDYPRKLVRLPPSLTSKAVYFDSYQQKNLIAKFYYQDAGDKLVFACTSYLYIDNNSRIVVSISKEFFDMPANFFSLPSDHFAQLITCQQNWQKFLDDLARQL